MGRSEYKLLAGFTALFEGREYRHRASNQGDVVASYLVDDLYGLRISPKLTTRVDEQLSVLNTANKTVGKSHRRGDGTFGAIVPRTNASKASGYDVSFGLVAAVEIGAETKILAKAMIKQIDRVGTDMINQAAEFRKHGNNPLCVGIVGINRAPHYRSLEGALEWITNGKGGHKHPIQEAEAAEQKLISRVSSSFDEVITLRFSATNSPPYSFQWVDQKDTEQLYGAALVRLCGLYERRF